ncbi:uncharacterized protein LOC129730909 [Wyeomyia smithii]|uniref:uncharacterized protein LOC129730909 n=1 Tax=Wyeomyia smithii TaxID=174621 RepID=UPI002467E895|nr:uncharacterized protein LOC129730909 [Wyeomyia smithii]
MSANVTPERSNLSKHRLQSPRTPLSPAGVTVGASRVRDAVEKCCDLHKKWQITIRKGMQYCSGIESLKMGIFEAQTEDKNPYPANLSVYCNNLSVLCGILQDVADELETLIEQMEVLRAAMKDELVGRSWHLGKVLGSLRTILARYKSDLSTRKVVAENIGHSCDRAELALHIAFWEQLASQDEDVDLLVRMLTVEFGLSVA